MASSYSARAPAYQWLVLALFIGICLGVGAVGGVVTSGSVQSWYPQLRKPNWTPPNWLFGPVWTTLYILMAAAAWLVWRERKTIRGTKPLMAFWVQLGLNLLWSVLFFGLRSPGAAFAEVLLLCLAVGVTLVLFWRVNRVSGLLLVPYAMWLGFASVLNGVVWWLNW